MILCLLTGYLYREGGTGDRKWARQVLIPVLVAGKIGLITNSFICFLLTILSFQVIRLGYGAYDPKHDAKPSFIGGLLKDRAGWRTRAIVGGAYGLIGLLPYALMTGAWGAYLGYSLINAGVNGLCSYFKLSDDRHETLAGVALGGI